MPVYNFNNLPGWKSKCKVSMESLTLDNLSDISNYYSMSLTNLDIYIQFMYLSINLIIPCWKSKCKVSVDTG